MRERLWAIKSNGRISADLGTYRLTVVMAGGLLRFLIHDCRNSAVEGCRPPLVASGTRPNIPAAIAAAEALATRLIAAYNSGEYEPDERVGREPARQFEAMEFSSEELFPDWVRPVGPEQQNQRCQTSRELSNITSFFVVPGTDRGAANDVDLFARS